MSNIQTVQDIFPEKGVLVEQVAIERIDACAEQRVVAGLGDRG